MGVTTPDMVRIELKRLNMGGLSWRWISANVGPYNVIEDVRVERVNPNNGEVDVRIERQGPMPPGTLSSIAKYGKVPKKWHRRLGLQELAPAPVCPECKVVHVKRCPRKRLDRRPWRERSDQEIRLAFLFRERMQ